MTGLPINISNAVPAQASPRQTASDSANQQDEQGFSNVLARQVGDANRQQASSRTDGEKDKQAEGQQNTETGEEADQIPAGGSAEMLATLLVQQNPETAPQSVNLSRVAADTAQGALNPDAGNMQQALHVAAGANANEILNTELLSAAASAKTGTTGKGKIELADRQKISGALEAATNTGPRLANGNPSDGFTLTAPSHQLAIPLSAAAPANPNTISTPVTQPAWGDELGQKITWMATQRNQSAELHLNPPQLGPLEVSLKMNGDQATALFTSPHAAVREAIEQALPRLREILADNGIMLNNAMVSDQSTKNNQDNAPRKPQGKAHADAGDSSAEIQGVLETRTSSIRRHNGMVDTFA